MTAIAAIRTSSGVAMGGDSAAVGGWYNLQIRRDRKVFRAGHLLIGYTSSFRMAQLMQFGLDDCLHVGDLRPPQSDDVDAGLRFMAREFVPRVRWLFNKGGYMRKKDDEENGGTFLVAWGRQLFQVWDDFQVANNLDDYAACGCGADLALGALHALRDQPMSGADKVRMALESAERFSAGVRSPFTIMSTEDQW